MGKTTQKLPKKAPISIILITCNLFVINPIEKVKAILYAKLGFLKMIKWTEKNYPLKLKPFFDFKKSQN